MTASSGKAEPICHCQHVLLMIAAKMPAVETEGKIFLIFLPLGTKGRKSPQWMCIGSQLHRSPSVSVSVPSAQSSPSSLLRVDFPHFFSNQVFLLKLWITSSLPSETVWAASLEWCENGREVTASLLLNHSACLHSLKFLKAQPGESGLQTVSISWCLFPGRGSDQDHNQGARATFILGQGSCFSGPSCKREWEG